MFEYYFHLSNAYVPLGILYVDISKSSNMILKYFYFEKLLILLIKYLYEI